MPLDVTRCHKVSQDVDATRCHYLSLDATISHKNVTGMSQDVTIGATRSQ